MASSRTDRAGLCVGYGYTVRAKGLAEGTLDGIAAYTRQLHLALGAYADLSIQPAIFGRWLCGETQRQPALMLRYAPGAVWSAVTGRDHPGSHRIQSSINLFHATDHLIPRLRRTPVIATIMDAIPLARPELIGGRLTSLRNALRKKMARQADYVLTISEHARQDISEHFGVPTRNIGVIPLGVDRRFWSPPPEEGIRKVLELGLTGSFFLFVGTLQPRKNLRRVIEAHRGLPVALRQEFPLVIAGRMGWQVEELLPLLQEKIGGRDVVRWLGTVDEATKHALLARARALVFPSLYEGFGLPVLEAFASGLPVITSTTTSLPEVAGDAALLVDPLDVDAIADAMQRIAEDDSLALELRERGLQRAGGYSWERCAEMTYRVYREIAS